MKTYSLECQGWDCDFETDSIEEASAHESASPECGQDSWGWRIYVKEFK